MKTLQYNKGRVKHCGFSGNAIYFMSSGKYVDFTQVLSKMKTVELNLFLCVSWSVKDRQLVGEMLVTVIRDMPHYFGEKVSVV